MKLKQGYERIQGEAKDKNRVYTRRVFWKIVTIFISPESVIIINGGFGYPQTFKVKTPHYDGLVTQFNALEDGLYKAERYWTDLACAWYAWMINGKPNNWGGISEYLLYEKYSPMTWG